MRGPGLLRAGQIDGTRYVDGGMHSTTNADLVAELEPRPDLALVSVPMSAVGRAVRGHSLLDPQLASPLAGKRHAARQGIEDDHVPADRGRPRGDVRRLDGPEQASAVCRQVVESRSTIYGGKTSSNA